MHESVAGSAPQGQSQPLDPMKAKAKRRLRLEHEISGLSNKALAIGLNTSEAQLTRYEGEQYQDDLPAHKIPALTGELGPGYMEWLAVQCGGTFHHGECTPATEQPLTVFVGLLAKHSGTTIQQLIQDMQDHHWTPQERRDALPGLRKLQGIVETLIHEAEGGVE